MSPLTISSAGPNASSINIGLSDPKPALTGRKVRKDLGNRVKRKSNGSSHYRFVSVTDLEEFKNPDTLRSNRSHVMYNVANKQNRRSPSPTMEGANNPGMSRKRSAEEPVSPHQHAPSQPPKRMRIDVTSTGIKSADALELFRRAKPPPKRRQGRGSSAEGSTPRQESVSRPTPMTTPQESYEIDEGIVKASTASTPAQVEPFAQPGLWLSYVLPTEQPTPLRYLSFGIDLDPFQLYPRPRSKDVNFDMLKKYCYETFSTDGLQQTWMSAVMEQRAGALSSLVLASSHRDIFACSRSEESAATLAARLEVISEIRQLLSDGKLATSDAAIVTLVQYIIGELMWGYETALVNHERGLQVMVRMRGGLDALGLGGNLAKVLTCVAFLSAIFREAQTDPMYLSHASTFDNQSFSAGKPLPLSPVLCPRGDFSPLLTSRYCTEQTYELLCYMRDISEVFLKLGQDQSTLAPEIRPFQQDCINTVNTIYHRVLLLPSSPNDYVYESTRLAATVYVTAMATRGSFSSATVALSQSRSPTLISDLKKALEKSDLSSNWKEMAGVLLWVALVGGAAARRHEERKWIVAVAIKSFVLLIFEHGGAVIESLRKLVVVMDMISHNAGRGEGGALVDSFGLGNNMTQFLGTNALDYNFTTNDQFGS